MREKYADKGIAFAAVSIDEESDHDKLRSIVASKKLAYPVPLDPRGEVLAKYANGASIPLTFVVSRSEALEGGRPSAKRNGALAVKHERRPGCRIPTMVGIPI